MSELTLKRKRSSNFSFEETELLLQLALSKKSILENKQSNAVSWKEKEKTWKNIADIFNSKTTGCPRDHLSLSLKYETIKKCLRGPKTMVLKTGGPPPKQIHPKTDLEQELYSIIQVSAEGLNSEFDSDSSINPSLDISNFNQTLTNTIDLESEIYEIDDTDVLTKTKTEDTNENDSEIIEIENYTPDISMQSDQAINQETWTPLDSTRLLRTMPTFCKLISTKTLINRDKKCQNISSKPFEKLAEAKLELTTLYEDQLMKEKSHAEKKHL